MNSAAASALFNMSALLSSTDPSLQTYSGNYQNSFFNRPDNPLSFPLAQPQNLYHKNLFSNGFQTFNDDADLIMFEQPKKLRNQDHTMNMLTGNNVTQGQLPRNPVFRKTPEIQSAKGPNIFSQGERVYNQNNSKETSESLSTNNSNSNFSEHALKREIIELDDDDNAIEPNEQTHAQIFSEPLALADDAISGLNRPQDQLLLLRNLMAQNNFPLQRPISDPSVNLLASQLLLANQFNQLSSRNYLNLMGNPSLYNANPSLTSSLLYNMQLNNLARQSQSQFLSTGFPEPSSITGKRFEPQGGFENLVRQDEILRPATAQSRARQEVILVDDDEFTWQGATSSRGQKKKIFLIEKTARRVTKPLIKTEKKKQVFTVIKCKPGQKFRPVRGYISRKTALLRANLRDKEEDSSEESRTPEETEGLRRSTRRRAERVFDSSAYIRAMREARDAKPVIEDYVINLHVTEGEENKDISETPIGEAFQVELVPFCIDMEAERPVKCVWDPEEIDQEMLEDCINKIESKFERKIVGQEFIIKTLRRYEMDVEKVIEEIETNKMTFRSFFEVKQKVSRNRIFHM